MPFSTSYNRRSKPTNCLLCAFSIAENFKFISFLKKKLHTFPSTGMFKWDCLYERLGLFFHGKFYHHFLHQASPCELKSKRNQSLLMHDATTYERLICSFQYDLKQRSITIEDTPGYRHTHQPKRKTAHQWVFYQRRTNKTKLSIINDFG